MCSLIDVDGNENKEAKEVNNLFMFCLIIKC